MDDRPPTLIPVPSLSDQVFELERLARELARDPTKSRLAIYAQADAAAMIALLRRVHRIRSDLLQLAAMIRGGADLKLWLPDNER